MNLHSPLSQVEKFSKSTVCDDHSGLTREKLQSHGHADPHHSSTNSRIMEIGSINYWYAIFALRGRDRNSECRVF